MNMNTTTLLPKKKNYEYNTYSEPETDDPTNVSVALINFTLSHQCINM